MSYKKYSTFLFFSIIFLLFLVAMPSRVLAGAYDGFPADYVNAITQSQSRIDSPSGWIPTDNSIVVIKSDHSTDATYGLK